jgi:hypothetical protein
MEVAIRRSRAGIRKRSRFNDIAMLQSWKLSHRVRNCFIRNQNERNETVSVTPQATKTGAARAAPAPMLK